KADMCGATAHVCFGPKADMLGHPYLLRAVLPFHQAIERRRMMGSLPQPVRDAADVSAVSQLVLRERLSRYLGLWEQMLVCVHDGSMVRSGWINASGPEFVRRSKEMAERNVKASHRLGPIFVTLAGERAIATLTAVIDIPFTLKGTEVMVSSHVRFFF